MDTVHSPQLPVRRGRLYGPGLPAPPLILSPLLPSPRRQKPAALCTMADACFPVPFFCLRNQRCSKFPQECLWHG